MPPYSPTTPCARRRPPGRPAGALRPASCRTGPRRAAARAGRLRGQEQAAPGRDAALLPQPARLLPAQLRGPDPSPGEASPARPEAGGTPAPLGAAPGSVAPPVPPPLPSWKGARPFSATTAAPPPCPRHSLPDPHSECLLHFPFGLPQCSSVHPSPGRRVVSVEELVPPRSLPPGLVPHGKEKAGRAVSASLWWAGPRRAVLGRPGTEAYGVKALCPGPRARASPTPVTPLL